MQIERSEKGTKPFRHRVASLEEIVFKMSQILNVSYMISSFS